MGKKNCWEFKKCGREPGGKNTAELGVCPAAIDERFETLNGGKNAGRCCWMVVGTFCRGKVQGTYACKIATCLDCDFYIMVCSEEKGDLASLGLIIETYNGRSLPRPDDSK